MRRAAAGAGSRRDHRTVQERSGNPVERLERPSEPRHPDEWHSGTQLSDEGGQQRRWELSSTPRSPTKETSVFAYVDVTTAGGNVNRPRARVNGRRPGRHNAWAVFRVGGKPHPKSSTLMRHPWRAAAGGEGSVRRPHELDRSAVDAICCGPLIGWGSALLEGT